MFPLGQLIGKGKFSKVYRYQEDKALKVIRLVESNPCDPTINVEAVESKHLSFRRELASFARLKHENIIKYHGYAESFDEPIYYIIMEYVPDGSLRDKINREKNKKLEESDAKNYTNQVLSALVYMHSDPHRVMHRDLKCQNILLSANNKCKLIDFGLSKRIETNDLPAALAGNLQHTNQVGTCYWMAPEVITGTNYTFLADVWSLGATVLEMLTGSPPYAQMGPIEAMNKIPDFKTSPLPCNGVISEGAKIFLKVIFVREKERPSSVELQIHPWLKG